MNAVAKRENHEVANRNDEKAFVSPQVNIFETKDGYLLEADLPGVTRDGLEVTLEDTTLTLIGRRGPQTAPGEVLYQESRACDYRRVFELDPSIDTGRIHARMDQGVLFLELPKAEKVKPRKIKIAD